MTAENKEKSRPRVVTVGTVRVGRAQPLAIISGPCVIESRKSCVELADRLAELARAEDVPLIFKASYDKANRSSGRAFRGPGLEEGLEILQEIKERTKLPVLTDVHAVPEVEPAAEVVDALQIPAFLCRQTDLLLEAGEAGIPVNVKKGQFLAPWDIGNVIEKVESTGNKQILLTERGVSFGYNNLVADMRSLLIMREQGYPVIFDATHSVQKPGGGGTRTTGDGQWAADLARAAVATGCDGVFMETHVDPPKAKSDSENAIPFARLREVWRTLKAIDELVR